MNVTVGEISESDPLELRICTFLMIIISVKLPSSMVIFTDHNLYSFVINSVKLLIFFYFPVSSSSNLILSNI